MKSIHTIRYNAFRDALRKARLAQGLTQKDVADRLGVHQSFVSKYESGERRLDVVEFFDVARALHTDYLKILADINALHPCCATS